MQALLCIFVLEINEAMKISIITVCYNSSKTIERTIQSVISQPYNDLEYIIVDGGSTDGTLDILEKYKRDIAIVISEPDCGIYDAMNKGIRCASGDAIGIINSDDWYEYGVVNKVVNYFKNNNVGVVYGKILVIDMNEKVIEPEEYSLSTIWYQMMVPHPSVFIKKEIYEKFGLFDLKYKISSDYELMLRLYSSHVDFGYIDEVIAYFRSGGASEKYFDLGQKEGFEIIHKYIDRCENKKGVFPEFENRRGWSLLDVILKYNLVSIQEMINNLFKVNITELVIFGAGKWGRLCYMALRDTDIKVNFILDNNAVEKQELCGIEVKKPDILEDMKPYILIAVKNGAEEIERQLDTYNIENYVLLSELVDTVCRIYLGM